MAHTFSTDLDEIKDMVRRNSIAGEHPFEGLTSSEIAEYNRALMFGDDDEAFPDEATWSMMVD